MKKDGSVVHLEVSGSRFGNYLFAVGRDVSGRVEAERNLRESEERYRSLAESSLDMIFIVNHDDVIEYVNEFAARLFGKAPEDILGRNRSELFPPEVNRGQKTSLKRVIKTGKPIMAIESQLVVRGHSMWISTNLIPLKDSSGRINRVMGISRDITERKKAEESLKESEHREAALGRLAQLALQGTGLTILLKAFTKEIKEVLNVDLVKILELEPDGKEFLLKAGVGWKKGLVGRSKVKNNFGSQAGYTLSNMGPVIVEDLSSEKRFSAPPLLSDHMVVSGISLIIGPKEKPYGILGAHTKAKRTFNEGDVQFLERASRELYSAIERYQREQRNLAMLKISENISKTLDIDRLISIATKNIKEATCFDHISIVLKEDGKWIVKSVDPNEKRTVKAIESFELGDLPKMEEAVKTKRTVFVQDCQDPGSQSSNAIGLAKKLGIRSGFHIPLIYRSDVIGILNLALKRIDPSFTDEDIRFYETIANELAAVVENALLYAELKKFTSGLEKKVKERTQDIQKLSELHENTIEAAPFSVHTMDKDLTVTSWNAFAEKYTTLKKEDIIGRNIFEKLPHLKKLGWDKMFKKVGETGEPIEMMGYKIVRELSDPGKILYQNIRVMPLKRGDEITGTVTIIEDVTEQRTAEESLQHSEERYRTLIETASEAIYTIGLEGRIETLNRAWSEITGFDRDEWIGKAFESLMHPKDRDKVKKEFQKALRTKNTQRYEARFKTSSGDWKWGDFSIVPRSESGETTGIFAIARDVTEQKKGREEIERANLELQEARDSLMNMVEDITEAKNRLEWANKKLLEADRLKSVFLASMSHELRTPLNSVIGFTGLMLQGMAGPLTEEQEKQLKIVYSNGKHLLSLIEDILDISKIEAGKIDINKEKFSLRDLTKDVIESLKISADAKSLNIENKGEIGMVYTDKKLFRQVLTNLIGNAIKFTEKGSIQIISRQIGKNLEISIKDTGIGISKKDSYKLFEPFQKIASPSSSEGTGLGLYLTRKIVNLLGGEITVESPIKKGSTFTFNIPDAL